MKKVVLLGTGDVFSDYEIFFKEKTRYSVITTTQVTLVIFSIHDIFKVLASDDVLILKKNIFVPPNKDKILNSYLTSLYFNNFKKKVLEEERVYEKLKNKKVEKGFVFQKSNQMTGFVNVEDYYPKQKGIGAQFKFFIKKGINNINNDAVCNPKSV